jgi:hypothetical protein
MNFGRGQGARLRHPNHGREGKSARSATLVRRVLVHVGVLDPLDPTDVRAGVRRLKVDLVMPRGERAGDRGRARESALLRELVELVVGEVGERSGVGERRAPARKADIAEERGSLKVVDVEQVRSYALSLDPLARPNAG